MKNYSFKYEVLFNMKKLYFKLVNYFHLTIGKLVTIKGTVIRVGSVGLICTSMAFECSSCHNIQAVMQPQGIFTGKYHSPVHVYIPILFFF